MRLTHAIDQKHFFNGRTEGPATAAKPINGENGSKKEDANFFDCSVATVGYGSSC